jgi:3-oxoacyl-[acyl-carrier protein] reductase
MASQYRDKPIGAYNAVRATLPRMLDATGGTVINVSSGAAHRALEGWAAYCSGKAGDVDERNRARNRQVRYSVFGLSPGVIDTDMQGQIRASGINRISRIPRAELAPAEHPARAIVYLCTEAADDLVGSESSLLDPEFRRRIGLSAP